MTATAVLIPQLDSPPPLPLKRAARPRKQNDVGYIWKDVKRRAWFLRYYDGGTITLPDGKIKYTQACRRLGSTDEIRNKDQARGKANEVLKPLTSKKGVTRSASTTIGEYVESVIFPWWERGLKPSTLHGYRKIWSGYLRAEMQDWKIAEYTTVDAGNFLDRLVIKNLNTATIAHIRNVATRIFAHAATKGIITGNPFPNAVITERVRPANPTYKYSMREIDDILLALEGNLKAQTAVGLTFFAGLRPGEARGARWENYNGTSLRIEKSVWRKYETTPKTESSVSDVPIVDSLAKLLSLLRAEEGQPLKGYILRDRKDGPLNLDRLARFTIKPRLSLAGLVWHGYYSCRRGLATVATDLVKDPTGAAGALRHRTIDTTANYYIGITREATLRTMSEVERLYIATRKQPKQLPANTQPKAARS